MQIRRYFLLIAAIVALPTAVIAQDSDIEDVVIEIHKTTQKADEYFESKEYSIALDIYSKAYSKEKSREQKQRISFNMAECYRFTGQCKRAASYYKRANKLGSSESSLVRYAEMLVCQGEFKEAQKVYEDFIQSYPNNPAGSLGLNNCLLALEISKDPCPKFIVDETKAPELKSWNSDKAELGITFFSSKGQNEVYISSMNDKSTGKKEDGWTGQRFSDIFYTKSVRSKKTKGGSTEDQDPTYEELAPLENELINTRDHEGVVSLASRGKRMFFTRCMNVKNVQLGCSIWEAKKVGQDWGNPTQVPLNFDSTASVGHPFATEDGKTLYFAGDVGSGKDIYLVTQNKRRQWGNPVKLSSIVNTDGNEIHPTLEAGYLYFSSDTHPGLGGYDVFRVKLDRDGLPIGDIENLGININSTADDLSIKWDPLSKGKISYVISNRNDKKSFNFFKIRKVTFTTTYKQLVLNRKTGKPLADSKVVISDNKGNSYEFLTDDQGYFTTTSEKNIRDTTHYKVNVSKKKFLNAQYDIYNEWDCSEFKANKEKPWELSREIIKPASEALILDPIEVPIVLPNVFFDLAKSDLREESKVALDTVYNILQRNPNITIGLRSHTDYRDTDAKNKVLSQSRAQSCVDYLIEKGIASDRLTAVGMGEGEPFVIPVDYSGYGSDQFKSGDKLTEGFIKRLGKDSQEIANQINRRTDFKVLSDDYVPSAPIVSNESGSLAPEKKNENPIGQTITLSPKDRSLGKIAMDNGMNVVQLKKLNGGLRGARPMPGMVLKVTLNGDYKEFDETHYQVQRGDQLRTISKKVGSDVKTLRTLNGIKSDKELIIGSWIQTK